MHNNNNTSNEIENFDDEYIDFDDLLASSIESNDNETFDNNELDSNESSEYNSDLEIDSAFIVEENVFDLDFDEQPVFAEDIAGEQEDELRNDVNENHLPPALLNFVRDAAIRDSRASETVALSFLILLSTLIRDKFKIYLRQFDLSAVLSPNLSGLVVSESRRSNNIGIKSILRLLFKQRQFISDELLHNGSHYFDFDKFSIENRRVFARGKIKFVKAIEIGTIEAIYTTESYEKYSNFLNADEQNFFASINENALPELLGKNGDASLLNGFILVYPPRHKRQLVDVEIDENILRNANKIFSQTEETIKDLQGNQLIMHLADDAREFYYDFSERIEKSLETAEEHPALVAYLAGFGDLFAQLSLLLYVAACAEAGIKIDHTHTVDLTAAKRAAAWCEILETHARAIFQNLFTKQSVENLILQKIADGKLGKIFTAREIARAQWTNLTSLNEIKKALDGLVDDGKIRVLPNEGTGRPKVRYELVDIKEFDDDLLDGGCAAAVLSEGLQ